MSRSLPDAMHWQIYQAYRSGPSTLFRLFEDVFGRLALCGSPDPDQQQRTIESLSDEIGQLKAQIEKLQAEVTELHADNFRLARRNAELEALVTKDSHNSSRPPSSDPPSVKKTMSLRQPSGRKAGGQPRHRGTTLQQVRQPDEVVVHSPSQCRGCGESLADGRVTGCERRQVFDLPPITIKVVEHQALTRRCCSCGHWTRGRFPLGVAAPVQYGPGIRARCLYLLNYQLLPYHRTGELMLTCSDAGCLGRLSTGSSRRVRKT
jgi:transposase